MAAKFLKNAVAAVLTFSMAFCNMENAAADGDYNQEKYTEKESTAEYPEQPQVQALSAVVIEADTGAVIFEKEKDTKRFPASITKIMTGILSVENLNMDATVTFTDDIVSKLPSDAAKLGVVSGETMTVKDCLYALMLRSCNDIAIGLGCTVSGSEEEFAKLMTDTARKAGAVNTNFVNATGLHDENHYTTAYDMALIAKYALNNPAFCQIWSSEEYVLSPTNVVGESRQIWNRHNMLVKGRMDYYEYAIGGKTGYTDEAGNTLVTCAYKDGLKLICVVMKSDSDNVYSDTRKLLEYGFNNFKKVSVSAGETRFGQSADSFFVSHSDLFSTESKIMTVGDSDYIVIPKNTDIEETGYRLIFDAGEDKKDSHVADIEYYIGGHYLGKTSLKIEDIHNDQIIDHEDTDVDNILSENAVNINIWYVVGIIVLLAFIVAIIIILNKTKETRKIKRARKKLFRETKKRHKNRRKFR